MKTSNFQQYYIREAISCIEQRQNENRIFEYIFDEFTHKQNIVVTRRIYFTYDLHVFHDYSENRKIRRIDTYSKYGMTYACVQCSLCKCCSAPNVQKNISHASEPLTVWTYFSRAHILNIVCIIYENVRHDSARFTELGASRDALGARKPG